ncbi:MAG: discoidin domain-containing protein [Kiritimatiellae bacterium]|nr:discoidin domain-containing protein [Kiritimatiellia bacterium]
MKRLAMMAAGAILCGTVAAETVTVKAGETVTWPAGKPVAGELLIKEGAGTLDLTGAELKNAGLEIREGAVSFSSPGESGPVTAQFFRFTVQASRPGKSEAPIYGGSGSQLAEFQLLKGGEMLPYPEGTTATSPSPGDASREGAPKAIDRDIYTKWYGGYGSPLTIDLTRPLTFDAYTFVTANDAIGRDPYTWTVEIGIKRKRGITWIPVGGETGFLAPEERFKPVGKRFTLRLREAFPPDYPVTIRGKGRLILDGVNETSDSLAGEGLVELRNATLTLKSPSAFTGTVCGNGTVSYPE